MKETSQDIILTSERPLLVESNGFSAKQIFFYITHLP